ncbi:MAG: 3-oxoacyl-ACP reductase FabG [Proteobacteria bacterium]|nr:3-oxoacyl-ACP reductase FabG [Pseudomonadota bacterium]MDE3207530.1 3-oxoacyl-ACP reductase FabG [Pseudomonadota bacterium]
MSRLNNQIAWVTGASRGIGQAIAHRLGADGATVIGTATTEESAHRISETFRTMGIRGEGMVLDVTDSEAVTTAVDHIRQTYGSVQILVNNAGITRDMLLMRMSDTQWNEVLQTNLNSVFTLCRAVLRDMMKARSGRIISITSVVGVMGNAGQANYAAAKAGLIGFTKSLAREVGSRNITVNCVAPGFIDTDMTRALNESQREGLLAHIPLGRLGSVKDVAAAVSFLASDEAGYITGSTMHVNGGMHMD